MQFYCQRKGGRAHVRFPNAKDKELKISGESVGKKKLTQLTVACQALIHNTWRSTRH